MLLRALLACIGTAASNDGLHKASAISAFQGKRAVHFDALRLLSCGFAKGLQATLAAGIGKIRFSEPLVQVTCLTDEPDVTKHQDSSNATVRRRS